MSSIRLILFRRGLLCLLGGATFPGGFAVFLDPLGFGLFVGSGFRFGFGFGLDGLFRLFALDLGVFGGVPGVQDLV